MPHRPASRLLNDRAYRRTAWAGIGVLLIAVAVSAFQGRWYGVATLMAFATVSVVFVMVEDRLPALFDLLFVLAALLNAAGWTWNVFRIGPYDEIVHAYTSFAATLAFGFLVFETVRPRFADHGYLYALTIASFGLSLGALWEVVEWVFGVIGPIDDTVLDLVMDTIGAVGAAMVAGLAVRVPSWRMEEKVSSWK